MLRIMKKQLDAWGVGAAMLLGTALWGCADAHARPPQHPEALAAPELSASEDSSAPSEQPVENVAVDPASWELAYPGGEPAAADYVASVDDYDPAADRDPSALTEFREVLAPYGQWTEDAVYGTVWIPDAEVVGPDFAPYVTAGHWALTEDDEWLWVSHYEWGWVPFHYGRWVWIAGRGWAWIPGRVYAPAWVVWRTGHYDDHYIGWAPMPPTWYWRSGVAVSLVVVPPAPYVFCSTHYIFTPHVHTHIVPASRVSVIARHTRPYYAATPRGRGYVSYARGPSPREARIPARAVPRASHHPRAMALAGHRNRITTTTRPRVDSRITGQPSRAASPQPRSPARTYSRSPAAISPRPSTPSRSFQASQPRSTAPAPRSAPPSRTSPRPTHVRPPVRPTTPRAAPVRPQVKPTSPRPAPVRPQVKSTSPRPAPVRPHVKPTAPRASIPKASPAPPKRSVTPRPGVRPSTRRALPGPASKRAK